MEARRLVMAVRRHLALLIVLPLLFGAAGWAFASASEATYSAEATLLVDASDPTVRIDPGAIGTTSADPAAVSARARTQIGIIEGRNVLEAAAEALGDADADSLAGRVTATQRGETALIDVAATAGDADDAKRTTDAVVAAYLADRRVANTEALQRALDEVTRSAGEIRESMTSPTADGTPLSDAEFRALESQFTDLSTRAREIEIALNLQSGGAEVVSAADVPDSPDSPQPVRLGLTAAVLGGFLAAAVAGIRERLASRIETPADVASITTAPVLGELPRQRRRTSPDGLVLVDDPRGTYAEGIRNVRASLQFLGRQRQMHVLLVTSGAPGDAKRLVALNLAAAYARCGNRVLLISADLRDRPTGDGDATVGLSDVIESARAASTRGEDVGRVVRTEVSRAIEDSRCAGLSILHPGSSPQDPNELLSLDATRLLLEHVRDEFEYVVIDGAPVGAVSDALVVARHADGVVVVVAADRPDRSASARVVEVLHRYQLPLAGVVLTGTKAAGRRPGRRARFAHVPAIETAPSGPTDERNTEADEAGSSTEAAQARTDDVART